MSIRAFRKKARNRQIWKRGVKQGQKPPFIQSKREKVKILAKKIKDVSFDLRTKATFDLYKDDISFLDVKMSVRES